MTEIAKNAIGSILWIAALMALSVVIYSFAMA